MKDIPFETAVEYAVDFIAILDIPALYNEKTAVIKVDDWRGSLPCDFESMIQVRMAPEQRSHKWGDSVYMAARPTYRYSGASFSMSEFKGDGKQIMDFTYKTQGMVIFTSTKDVDLEIAYRAFAIDEEGYPLLPDNPSFLRALENYIKMNWFTVLFDMGKIPSAVLDNTQREYYWAVGEANGDLNKLDLDKAETLFNSFKTLLPRNNEHWRGFFTNGAKEFWRK